MKKFTAFFLALLLFSVSASAAGYVAIPVNKNYNAVCYEDGGFLGGLVQVTEKNNSMRYALMDKNGNVLTDSDMAAVAVFLDGSYVYTKEELKNGSAWNRTIVFVKNGKVLNTIETLRDGQELYPPYYTALNTYEKEYHSESALFDVTVLPFYDFSYNGSHHHLYTSDGKPLYTGTPAATYMVDRGVWIELLDVKEKRIGWVNKNTCEFTVETPENPYIHCGGYGAVKNGNVYEVYNNEGELQFTYNGSQYTCTVSDLRFDKNGYAIVYKKPVYGSDTYGIIDTKGNLVVPLEYAAISDTEDGVIRAAKREEYGTNIRYGLLDLSGNVIVDFQYAYITPFENGIAAYRKMFYRDKGGYIDTAGNVLAEGQYLTDDNCLGKWGVYVAPTGEEIVTKQSEDSVVSYSEVALYDKSGKRLTKKPYEYIGQFNEGLAPVLYVVDPLRNDLSNTWRLGYIDTHGNEVIPCEFRFTNYDRLKPYYYTSLPLFKSGAVVLYKDNAQYIVHNPLMTNGVTALKNTATVMVNGEKVAVDAYNVDGYNYFRLRDVAAMLNGTGKQFNVGWNTAKSAIDLQMGKGYAGAITFDGQASANARLSYPTVYRDGALINEFNDERIQTFCLSAYDVCVNGSYGNNFIKLRDLGQFFDFNVSYDEANRCISIDTTKPY